MFLEEILEGILFHHLLVMVVIQEMVEVVEVEILFQEVMVIMVEVEVVV